MIGKEIRLCDLKKGERARVCAVNAGGRVRRRLQDMGFSAGAAVECVMVSPLGDPSAYLIRGAVIAIRRADAAGVSVRRTGAERAVV